MKARIVFILMLLVTTAAFTQTEKGNFMLGGNLGLSSSDAASNTITSANLSPNISYFFTDRLAVGLITPYSTSKSKDSGGGFNSTSWNYSVGPTVRYYFLNGKMGFFPEVSYSWGWNGSHASDASGLQFESSGNGTLLTAGAGAAYFINKNIAIEGILSYKENYRSNNLTSSNPNPLLQASNSATTRSFNFQIGFQIYLNPKNK